MTGGGSRIIRHQHDVKGLHATAPTGGTSTEVLTLLVLNFALDIVDGVRALHLQRDGLASQGLDKDLHAATQPQHQVESGLLLDVVVSQGAPILQLLAGKDQPLLVRGNTCSIGSQVGQCADLQASCGNPTRPVAEDMGSGPGSTGRKRDWAEENV